MFRLNKFFILRTSTHSHYKQKTFKFLLILIIFLSLQTCDKEEQTNNLDNRANIIFILADDLGFTDVNYFANHITGVPISKQYFETQNIDRLAIQGVAFTQAYANPLCSPSRASLLTGKNAARLGFTTATLDRKNTYYGKGIIPENDYHPLNLISNTSASSKDALISGSSQIALPSDAQLDKGVDEITIAEALTGYKSAYLGKWHVGGHGAKGYQPSDQGFEELAYYDAGSSPYFNWRTLWQNKHVDELFSDSPATAKGSLGKDTGEELLTNELTSQALNYIDDRANDKKPFLLYFSHFAVHRPLQTETDIIAHFTNKDTKGWKGQNNEIYAAMVNNLDQSVGLIFNKLKETGLDNNTYIIFMSDNGGVHYVLNKRGVPQEGNMEHPVPTSNSPLKGGKATVYEGGVRVPLIIWKKNIENPKKVVKTAVDITDIFPTILAMSGEDAGTYINNVSDTNNNIDGQSLLPLLSDKDNSDKQYTKDTIYWHYPFNVRVNSPRDNKPLPPHSAIRKGRYKLIVDWYGRLSFYDIDTDPFEQTNLLTIKPDKVKEMCSQFLSWLDKNVEVRYFPQENENYNPAEEIREQPYKNIRHLNQCVS